MSFPRNNYIESVERSEHSKEFLDITLQYAEHLDVRGLPVIFSLKHLSQTFDMTYTQLKDIILHRDNYYSTYKISKKRGGHREIQAPNSQLKFIQRWIYHNILKNIALDPSCQGFRKGACIKQNALFHVDKEAVLKLDLERFYDYISEKRVYSIFRNLGYHSNLAVDLAKLTTVPYSSDSQKLTKEFGYLPQGAPTSPMLSNMVLIKLDKRLRILSEKQGITYSRYADDITFSGLIDKIPSVKLIQTIVEEEGFKINHSKTRLQKKGQRQMVTGLTVSNGVHIPKEYKRNIRKHLYFCKKYGPEGHLKKIGEKRRASYKDWVFGQIAYVYSVEPETGKQMMEDFNSIDWVF